MLVFQHWLAAASLAARAPRVNGDYIRRLPQYRRDADGKARKASGKNIGRFDR